MKVHYKKNVTKTTLEEEDPSKFWFPKTGSDEGRVKKITAQCYIK